VNLFLAPVVVSLAVFAGIFWWGGVEALLLTLALSALEISLSFDNAVINAKVLGQMPHHWQRRFLTWGMPLAVFGVRFILPILIVAVAALVSPWGVAVLAFKDPAQYAQLLAGVDPIIHAFGGAFLLMVALNYFFDEEKTVHWFSSLERRLVRWGEIAAIEIFVALSAVVAVSLAAYEPMPTLFAGATGIALYIGIERVTTTLTRGVKAAAASGLALFIYLNILDAAFSLDGVVGAFALTTQIFIILAGLGIGAYFVRTFTVYLTRREALRRFMYLEHGAHWAIFFLAICLFAALFTHVPEVIPGSIGLVFAILSFVSSRRERRALGLE
jgi:hypothetical protein